MSEAARIVLIALGVALLVVALAPLLFMTGMMGAVVGGGVGGGAWTMGGLVALLLVSGIVLLAIALRRQEPTQA